MIGKYIFYTFNTLTWHHVEMALESIACQDFESMEFALYNVSLFPSSNILALAADVCGTKFSSYTYWNIIGPTTSTMEDVNCQINGQPSDCNADWYLVHKSDFYLGKDAISNASTLLKTEKPLFVNFSKFDLRENITDDEVRHLARMTFDEILDQDGATDLTDSTPADWGVHYNKIGYRGIDGVMHGYTEAARKLLSFDTFIGHQTVADNVSRGVDWHYGDRLTYALHIFHELPGGRNHEKDIMGYRF